MQSTEREVRLKDKDGESHEYRQTLFPATEGWSLLTRITSVGGAPLGQLLHAVVGEGKLVDAMKSERTLDWNQMGQSFSDLAKAIISEGSTELVQTLLKYTTRDNRRLVDGGDATEFDRAYTGNYGEMLAAVVWVLRQNFESVLTAPFDAAGAQS